MTEIECTHCEECLDCKIEFETSNKDCGYAEYLRTYGYGEYRRQALKILKKLGLTEDKIDVECGSIYIADNEIEELSDIGLSISVDDVESECPYCGKISYSSSSYRWYFVKL